MLDFMKTPCPICGQPYFFARKAGKCCKDSPLRAAWQRNLDRKIAVSDAIVHDRPTSSAGLGLKPCPRCKGETGHWNCPLCDGCGQVPENML